MLYILTTSRIFTFIMDKENIGIFKSPEGNGPYIKIHSDTYLTELNTALRFYNNHGFITCDDTCYGLVLHAATDNTTGAFIQLHAKNRSTYPGEVRFCTCNEDGSNTLFRACTNGNLLWDGRKLEGIYSKGTNYIQYTNGLLMCWGSTTVNITNTTVTFPKSYKSNPNISFSIHGDDSTTDVYGILLVPNTTNFVASAKCSEVKTGLTVGLYWMSIGYWK